MLKGKRKLLKLANRAENAGDFAQLGNVEKRRKILFGAIDPGLGLAQKRQIGQPGPQIRETRQALGIPQQLAQHEEKEQTNKKNFTFRYSL